MGNSQETQMSANDGFWNRDELYEEVWATPTQTLAKKYGISDVGLAKVCRKLAIPVPGRGYWARKDAGQEVKQVPLPALKEKIILRKPSPRPEPPKLNDFATEQEIAQLEQLERTTGEVMLTRSSLAHPLIVRARAVLRGAQADNRKILWTRESCLDIRVSKDSLDRALHIMAGLIRVVDEAGFAVSVEAGRQEKREQTVTKIHGQAIRFGLTEKVDRVEISAPPKGGLLERVLTFGGRSVTLKPSGRLTIEVWSEWGSNRRSWKDGKSQRLEEQVPRIVAGFIRLALADRADKEHRAAEERERLRIAEERARLEASIKAEQSKVNALRNAVARWSRAEQIRSFICAAREAAIHNGQAVEQGSPFGDWVTWAEQQADRLDPLKESPPSIIDQKPRTEYAGYYSYGNQKPDPPFRFPKPIWRME
jgi:hypothetical protein